MVILSIYLVLGLMGLGLLAMLVFGIRSAISGKVNVMTMGIVALPFILLLILGLVMPTWAQAGIFTIIITLAGALVALLVTGVRGLFS